MIPFIILLFLHEMVFLGKISLNSDAVSIYPMGKWGDNYIEKEAEVPQWYPHLFGGMPSYGGYIYTPANPVYLLLKHVFINRGIRYWFHFTLGGLGMFLYLRRRKLSSVSSMFGAIALSLTPYMFGLINAGHSSKIVAIGYIPFLLLAFDYVFHRSTWRGILYLGLASALQLWANHPQIVYYTWMLAVLMWLWHQISSVVKREWSIKKEGVQTGVIIAAIALASLLVIDPYISAFQFQAHSTRGATSVLDKTGETETGTSWEYATAWSFHPKETISFVYPYFYGLQNYSTRDLKSVAYWGYMPMTQSTHYLGILTVVLALIGFVIKKPDKQSIFFLIATGLILIVGFGRFFPILYWPLFKLAPLFSKFRIPSMIYILLPFTVSYLGSVGLEHILHSLKSSEKSDHQKLRKWTLIILGTIAGLSLLFLLLGDTLGESTGFYSKADDYQRFSPQVMTQLKAIRQDIFQKGLLLALFISSGCLGTLWLGVKQSLKPQMVGWILVGISVIDLWVVDQEFLDLKRQSNMRQQFRSTAEVDYLKKDTTLFRILPFDDFNRNWYAYFNLPSVGGYRPVKLRTYQDFMDAGGLQKPESLNMLNVKYLITTKDLRLSGFRRVYTGKQNIFENQSVLPKAWFVSEIVSVSNQKESLQQVIDPNFNPSRTAVVINYRGPELLKGGIGSAEVTTYNENQITLETICPDGGLLVLSENYYKPGWIAEIEGSPIPIFQTNHILQSVYIPAGKHTISFTYNTRLFDISRLISRISLFLFLLIIVFIHRAKLSAFVLKVRKKA